MKKIEIEFQPTANDKNNILHSQLEKQIIEKVTVFRKSVFEMISEKFKVNVDQIKVLQNAMWDFGYSQVYCNGIFCGHLHEDFINCKFTFNPA